MVSLRHTNAMAMRLRRSDNSNELAKLLAQEAGLYTLVNQERLKIVRQSASGPFDPTKYQVQAHLLCGQVVPRDRTACERRARTQPLS